MEKLVSSGAFNACLPKAGKRNFSPSQLIVGMEHLLRNSVSVDSAKRSFASNCLPNWKVGKERNHHLPSGRKRTDGARKGFMIKTEKDILTWIHDDLGGTIRELTSGEFSETPYTEALIAALICRETGFLIKRYANKGMTLDEIAVRMKGDYGRRPGEAAARYHGYGFVQIDTGSYPDFINSTPLGNYKAYLRKAILVLEEKRKSIVSAGYTTEKLGEEYFLRAILAAYNSGQGNVIKSLKRDRDVDSTTYQFDYSKDVMRMRYVYGEMYMEKEG